MFDLIPAALSFIGGMEQRDSQEDMFSSGQQFNSAEAALQREFNASEAAKAREFNQYEASVARAFNQSEAGVGRDFNSAEAAKAREFNASEAAINREYQERMSSTAYQRATKDMMAAGINPMLAFMKGGASTPGGSQASGSAASSGSASGSGASGPAASGSAASSPGAPHLENMMAGAVTSGLSAQKIGAEIEVLQEQARLVGAQADNEAYRPSDNLEDEHGNIRLPTAKVSQIMADTQLKLETAGKTKAEVAVIEPTIRKILNEVQEIASKTQLNVHSARKLIEDRLNVMTERGLISAQIKNVVAETVLRGLEAKVTGSHADFAEQTGILGPAINSASKAASIPFQLRPRVTINPRRP